MSAGGSHDLPPQAGLGVYERGPDGLLAAARAYDDVVPPAGARVGEYVSLIAAGYRAAAARGPTAAVMSPATDGGNHESEQ